MESSLGGLLWMHMNSSLVPQSSFISSKHIKLVFCIHKPTHTPISIYIFLAFPHCFPSATPTSPIREIELKKHTTCLANYSAHGGASAWAFLLIVGCHGGTILVLNVRSCPPSHLTAEWECGALATIPLFSALSSRSAARLWQPHSPGDAAAPALPFPAPRPSPGPAPSSIPLPPGADVEALRAASPPVSMTTRVTSAPGLSITARTPGQLNECW